MDKLLALQLFRLFLHVEQEDQLYFLCGNLLCPFQNLAMFGAYVNSLMVVWLQWFLVLQDAMTFTHGLVVLFHAFQVSSTFLFLILWFKCKLMIHWMQLLFMEDPVCRKSFEIFSQPDSKSHFFNVRSVGFNCCRIIQS